MTRRKHLTPEQTEQLNRTLRHLAEDLERKRKPDPDAEQLAVQVGELAGELHRGWCA